MEDNNEPTQIKDNIDEIRIGDRKGKTKIFRGVEYNQNNKN